MVKTPFRTFEYGYTLDLYYQ